MLTALLLSTLLLSDTGDTLSAAHVRGVKDRPVVRATEETKLSKAKAVPWQLADVLRNFTGVQVKDYGGAGGLKTINVRSLGSEHTGVFIDGIQIDNAQNMQVDLSRFSTDGFGTVSLFNASKSVRLQTAREYASGASVHLETLRPESDLLRLKLRTGSFSTVNPSVEWHKLKGGLAIRSSAEFLYSGGRYEYPYFDTTLVRENADIRSLRAEAQLMGRLDGGEWRLHLNSYGSERGFPGPVIRRAAAFPFSAERQADQDCMVQASWVHDWSESYSTALRGKYSYNYTHYSTHPELNPMALPYDLHYRQHSAYLSLAQTAQLGPFWSADLATDLQGNGLEHDAQMSSSPRRVLFTGALAVRMERGKFRTAAHLAYMGAYDSYSEIRPGAWNRDSAWRDAWMPSLSMAWEVLPWLEADAFVKQSCRLPSFNDLYYTLIGNSALKPESALQLGSDFRLHWEDAGASAQFRLSPYFNSVTDKIVAIPTVSQFRWTMLNIGLVHVTGLDLSARASRSGRNWSASASLRYSFQRAVDRSVPGSQTFGNQIPYIPLHSGSVYAVLSWRQWTLSWDTAYSGRKWSRSANTQDYLVPSWTTSDVALERLFLLGKNADGPQLKLALRCSNVFDARYQIVQAYPMPGRSIMLNAEFSF